MGQEQNVFKIILRLAQLSLGNSWVLGQLGLSTEEDVYVDVDEDEDGEEAEDGVDGVISGQEDMDN